MQLLESWFLCHWDCSKKLAHFFFKISQLFRPLETIWNRNFSCPNDTLKFVIRNFFSTFDSRTNPYLCKNRANKLATAAKHTPYISCVHARPWDQSSFSVIWSRANKNRSWPQNFDLRWLDHDWGSCDLIFLALDHIRLQVIWSSLLWIISNKWWSIFWSWSWSFWSKSNDQWPLIFTHELCSCDTDVIAKTFYFKMCRQRTLIRKTQFFKKKFLT